jgi:hypothetical protein
VRMRSRKPWVFARRRLFGWNVRLLTVDAFRTVARSREYPYRAVPGHEHTPIPPAPHAAPPGAACLNPTRVLGAFAAFQTASLATPHPVAATG